MPVSLVVSGGLSALETGVIAAASRDDSLPTRHEAGQRERSGTRAASPGDKDQGRSRVCGGMPGEGRRGGGRRQRCDGRCT